MEARGRCAMWVVLVALSCCSPAHALLGLGWPTTPSSTVVISARQAAAPLRLVGKRQVPYSEVADEASVLVAANGSLGDAMGLPAEKNGLKLSRWVVCSWQVANISALEITRTQASLLQRIPQLLASFSNLAPDQVHAAIAANVTLGFTWYGVTSSGLNDARAAMQAEASEMAGGYNPELILFSPSPPPADGARAADVMREAGQPPPVVLRSKDLGPTPAAALSAAAAGRRLQQQEHAAAAAARRRAAARRLLQQQQQQKQQQPAQHSPASGGVPVWLTYMRVAPDNTSTLLAELCNSCDVDVGVPVGFDFAPQPCGQELKHALERAGVRVNEASYAQVLSMPATVSLSVRLAVGITASQVAAGVDVALAKWLNEPATAQAMANLYTPDAVIKWLHTPEVWAQKAPTKPPGYLSPGAAVGVGVGVAAFICGCVGLTAWAVLARRRRRADAAAAAAGGAGGGQDAASSSSGDRPRRRRQGKRRYLLPEAQPRADPSGSETAAAAGDGAGTSGTSGASGDAGVGDAEPSLDQMRPELRSLGDSVTSAVRFEQSDDEDEPSSTNSRSVLQAREALLAEQRRQQAAPAAPQRGATAVAAAVAAAAAAGVGASAAAASGSASGVERAGSGSSSTRLHQPAPYGSGGISTAVDMCSALTPATSAADDHSLLQPVDERAAAASAAAVAAAASLPDSGAAAAGSRPSPFAAGGYNFSGCLEGHAPAAAPAAAVQPPAAEAADAAGVTTSSGQQGARGVVLQHLVSVARRCDVTPPGTVQQQLTAGSSGTTAGSLSQPQPSTSTSCVSTLLSAEPVSCDSDAPAALGRRSVDDTGRRMPPAGCQQRA